MTIDLAKPADLNAILQLYEELYRCMAALQPENFQPARQKEARILALMGDEHSGFLTARTQQGRVAGFALVQEQATPDFPCFIPRRYTCLMDLVVAEDCRGQGTGRALLKAAEDWARARHSEFIELGVLSENQAALRAYESCGYTECGKVMRRGL